MYLRNLSGMSGIHQEQYQAVTWGQLSDWKQQLCCVCKSVTDSGSSQAIDVPVTASRQRNRRQMKICQCIIRRDASAGKGKLLCVSVRG
jgi:hypothetical protein